MPHALPGPLGVAADAGRLVTMLFVRTEKCPYF
jgi:hypothetical protein